MTAPAQPGRHGREIDVEGIAYDLRAAPDVRGGWRATVAAERVGAGGDRAIDALGNIAADAIRGWSALDGSEGEALDALERRIRAAVAEATARTMPAPRRDQP
jgi:hypothetical protein